MTENRAREIAYKIYSKHRDMLDKPEDVFNKFVFDTFGVDLELPGNSDVLNYLSDYMSEPS